MLKLNGPEPNLDQWFVCPVQPHYRQTEFTFLDRTPGFLVRSNIAEIALDLAKPAGAGYMFTGEIIPYKDYVPGLSTEGMIGALRRWIGYMNHPDDLPLGAVVQMD